MSTEETGSEEAPEQPPARPKPHLTRAQAADLIETEAWANYEQDMLERIEDHATAALLADTWESFLQIRSQVITLMIAVTHPHRIANPDPDNKMIEVKLSAAVRQTDIAAVKKKAQDVAPGMGNIRVPSQPPQSRI